MNPNIHCLIPDWPAPKQIKALVSLRASGNMAGISSSPWWDEWNLPHAPSWLKQVHGTDVLRLTSQHSIAMGDAVYTQDPGRVCAILTADCLPILLSTKDGSQVAAVHAGWRGLAAGIIDETLKHLRAAPQEIIAWLGPAIGPDHFEVGSEVRDQFIARNPDYSAGFLPGKDHEHWFADLYHLARINFSHCQIQAVYGGGLCTYCDTDRFFSYRREKSEAGRMASLIWIDTPVFEESPIA